MGSRRLSSNAKCVVQEYSASPNMIQLLGPAVSTRAPLCRDKHKQNDTAIRTVISASRLVPLIRFTAAVLG